jgi:hypothetical protein
MRRIRNSATVIRISTAVTPVVSRLNTILSAGYSKLCRDHRLQRRVIALCAGVASVVFFVNIIQLQSQKQQLAANFTVFVATSDIAAGDPVTTDMVRPLLVPASLVAASVIIDFSKIAYARQSIGVGELITSINVADKSSDISIVPVGWRTIAITSPTALPPMSAGDHVDVIANGVVLVANAVVVSTTGELSSSSNMIFITHVVIGVPAESAPSVATAAALGDVTLVVAL